MPGPPGIREPIPHQYSLPQAKKEKPVSLLNSATTGQGTDTVTSIEDVLGSRFDDHIDGDNGSNGLRGFHGDDILIGGPGNDTLNGGDDLDTCNGETETNCKL